MSASTRKKGRDWGKSFERRGVSEALVYRFMKNGDLNVLGCLETGRTQKLRYRNGGGNKKEEEGTAGNPERPVPHEGGEMRVALMLQKKKESISVRAVRSVKN